MNCQLHTLSVCSPSEMRSKTKKLVPISCSVPVFNPPVKTVFQCSLHAKLVALMARSCWKEPTLKAKYSPLDVDR